MFFEAIPSRLKKPAQTFAASYLKLDESDDDQWTPMSSFLFAATTVIPVGYGFITPATRIGRLLIIAYGLFGAPLALVTVTDIGEFISPYMLNFFEKIPGLAGIYCLLLLALYIFVCALLFHVLSTITLLDSVYFSITTVFTIGYGDTKPPIATPTLICFIIVGVTLVTITVEIVAGEVINQIHYMGRKVGNARKFASKMLQMAHFSYTARGKARVNEDGSIASFSHLGLLMSLEDQSILLGRPQKTSLKNRPYDPKNLRIQYVDVTSPNSSVSSSRLNDRFSLSSFRPNEASPISSIA